MCSHADLIIMIIKFIDYHSCFVPNRSRYCRQFLACKNFLQHFISFHTFSLSCGSSSKMLLLIGVIRWENFISSLKIMSVLNFLFSLSLLYPPLFSHFNAIIVSHSSFYGQGMFTALDIQSIQIKSYRKHGN